MSNTFACKHHQTGKCIAISFWYLVLHFGWANESSADRTNERARCLWLEHKIAINAPISEWVKCGCWQIERIKIHSFNCIGSPVRRTEKHQATKPCQIIRGKLSCELPIMGRLYIRSLCGSLSNIYFRYLRVMTGFSPRYQIAIKYHYLSTCFVHSWRETNYMHKNGRHNESNMCFQPEICNQSMSICRYTERRRG